MMAYAGRLPPKGVPFLPEMVYTRVRGWTSGGASPYKHLLNTPPPRGVQTKKEKFGKAKKEQQSAKLKMIKPDDCTQVISKLMKMCFLMHYFVNKTAIFLETMKKVSLPFGTFTLPTLTKFKQFIFISSNYVKIILVSLNR